MRKIRFLATHFVHYPQIVVISMLKNLAKKEENKDFDAIHVRRLGKKEEAKESIIKLTILGIL